MEETHDTIYLIDGSAYIYRAFYAIRHLTNKEGLPTNALYGFTQMIRTLLETENPEYVVMTFDDFEHRETNFRNKIYSEYKANRKEMPDDLKLQIPYFRQIVEALNIPVLCLAGVEADDIIATLCRRASEEDLDICIISADKDLMQLLGNTRVRMVDTMRNKVFTRETAIERFGVIPEKIKYVLALAGDSSDNVPGVPGIGEKTGGKLIAEFGDLESVLSNIDKISGKKRKENLEEFADQARMSLELVLLKEDCDVSFELESLRLRAPDFEKVSVLFTQLDFGRPLRDIKSWMRRRNWLSDAHQPPMPKKVEPIEKEELTQKDYKTIFTLAELEEVFKACSNASRFSFDLETTSLDPLDAIIIGISFSWEANQGVYIPIEHRYIGAPEQLDLDLVLAKFKPLFEAPLGKIICQNFKYEFHVLARYGIHFTAIEWDTMLMSYLLDPGRLSQGLNALAKDFLGYAMTSYTDLVGKGRKQIAFEMVEIDRATHYAAEDADITLMLCQSMEESILKANLKSIHDDIEIPASYVLAKMEKTGVCIDGALLYEMGRGFEKELTILQKEIEHIAERKVNPNSPQQLREVLFDQLKLPIKKQNKSGPSTDSSVLEELIDLHPLPAMILEFRSFSKLKGTYIDALPALVRKDTQRVHTDFNQAVASTGRLSSSNPNLQNIPIRTARGREIRRAFIPQKGWMLLCADYSQIELRIMAHMAQDETLINAYQNGDDIHAITASNIFDVSLADVTSEQRSAGKTITFGVMYGMGPNRLAKALKITRPEAREYIAQYFNRYSAVRHFFDGLVGKAVEKGYAETLFGRRRLLDDLLEGTRAQRSFAERVAINTPIQGTAADIIKIAMVNLDRELERSNYRANILLQVHDELVLEAHPDDVERVRELLVYEMGRVCDLDVPLVVECGVGANWLEAK